MSEVRLVAVLMRRPGLCLSCLVLHSGLGRREVETELRRIGEVLSIESGPDAHCRDCGNEAVTYSIWPPKK